MKLVSKVVRLYPFRQPNSGYWVGVPTNQGELSPSQSITLNMEEEK
jgi:hypothetical protein